MGCPICHKHADARFSPFCSRRCADVDLAHWLRGDYVLPGPPADPFEDDLSEAEDTLPRGTEVVAIFRPDPLDRVCGLA